MDDVARLGLGLAALGRPAYITAGRDDDLGADRSVEAMRDRAAAVLDAAWAAGVRHFDTARSYGRAEEFLAHWLASRPDVAADPRLVVASKWGYRYVGGWRMDAEVHEVKDHSLAAFREQLAETRALLGDHLRLYQVHSVTPDSPVLHDDALLRTLAAERERGLRIGLSASGPRQADVVRSALEVDVDCEPLFSAVQTTWNPLEPSAGRALAEAAAAGWLVVVKESLANGRLAPGGDADAQRIAAEIDVPLDQLALATALAQPWAGVVLSGAVTPDQVASGATAARLDLDDDALHALTPLAQEPATYWRERSARIWH
ncbi:Predicted oxidoreductase [Quadrisphaera granulorum]|uniref:Aryl-alcohol dehydrogenase-like predicted oxidoreductase n=1 Tax=Quadrisphaera granulorum TaxID=317664 RepID=A0A316AFW2_9ACTN|nr:aldo/keto reductase [Quadrisphaera granulorum]PWJ55860.1 aryl-alcohol dehydrogenase-like predicted oxidoreductase [Quadrisphaera granulorum]SZE95357.1 Predicted oxidoreductase [Quadrisphaera granulorum]